MKIVQQANLLRIGFVFILLILELFFYYQYGIHASIPIHVTIYLFFSYWYYSESINNQNLTDKLILFSFFGPIISEILKYVTNGVAGLLIEIFIFGLSHVFIIIAYRNDKSKIITPNIKVAFPFIIFPVAFVIFVLLPVLSTAYLILVVVILIEITYIALLSVGLSYPLESIFYVTLSSFFLILCTGLYAYHAFISTFLGIHAAVLVSIVLFRIFLILGMLNRSTIVKDLS